MSASSVLVPFVTPQPRSEGLALTPEQAEQALAAAVGDLQAGRVMQASTHLAGVEAGRLASPIHCSLAGLVHLMTGRPQAALDFFDTALRAEPDLPEALVGRANTLSALGRSEAALADFERAASLGSNDAVAHYNRGNLLRERGRLDDAIAAYDLALRLQPAFPEALRAGGIVLRDMGKFEGALRFFAEAARLAPDHLDTVLDHIVLLHALCRFDEAIVATKAALQHLPASAGLHSNLGVAQHEIGQMAEARASFEAALRLDPNLAQARLSLGNVLVHMDEPAAALAHYDAALALRPGYLEALSGRGLSLVKLGRTDDALASFEAALAIDPRFVFARANRGEAHLLLGNLQRGWADYECRFLTGRQDKPVLKHPAPDWQGEAIAGQRIIACADQGNGDILQFARYLPDLKKTGADVTVYCPPRLQAILAPVMAGLRVVGELPDETFDRQVTFSSFPYCFDTAPETIPLGAGYLRAEPQRIVRWAARIGEGALRIGLCWRGAQHWQSDPRRSLPLEALAPLAALDGVRLFSLQMPDNTVTGGITLEALGIDPVGAELDRDGHSFVDTAAVMASLDLIVTVDTSIAHLAGALGRPTFVLLQSVPEWRFGLGTDRSPWYASMRLFRQKVRREWDAPVAEVVEAVRGMMG